MHDIVYMNIHELSEFLTNNKQAKKSSQNKFYTHYDITIILLNQKCIYMFCQDKAFSETLRRVVADSSIIQNIFAPSCRCCIINYETIQEKISIHELCKRYKYLI